MSLEQNLLLRMHAALWLWLKNHVAEAVPLPLSLNERMRNATHDKCHLETTVYLMQNLCITEGAAAGGALSLK